MAVTAFADIRTRVRRTLQDADGDRWTDDELDDYINEGQLEYARQTRILRGRFPIFIKENEEVYTLPEDVEEILRVEDKDGREITLTTSDTLEREVGNAWRQAVGGPNPSHAYANLNGKKTISFYPRPKPSVEISPTLFEIPRMQSINVSLQSEISAGGIISIDYDERNEEIIVLTFDFIEKYDNDWRLLKRIPHGISVSTGGYIRVMNVSNSENPGTIFFSDAVLTSRKIYRMDTNDVISTYGTASGSGSDTINAIFPVRRKALDQQVLDTGTNLYFLIGGEIRSTPIDSFFETTHASGIGKMLQSSFANINKDSEYLYYTTDSPSSIRRIKQTPPIVDEVVTSTGAWSGITILDDDELYAVDTGVIKKIGNANDATVGNVTITAVSGLDTLIALGDTFQDFPLYSDGETVFSVEPTEALGVTEYQDDKEIDNYPAERTFVRNVGVILNYERAISFNGRIYWSDFDFNIWGNLLDEGGIVNIDNVVFNGEFGALTDYDDTDNPVYIEGEEGAITQVFDAGDEFNIWFVRSAKPDIIEITEELALVNYTLHKAFEKEFDEQNFNKAAYYFRLYDRKVKREMARKDKGLINAKTHTRTYYF